MCGFRFLDCLITFTKLWLIYVLFSFRLDTIMKSDRVLVMDRGTVVEFDSPKVLLGSKRSFFYGLVHSNKSEQS